MENLYLGVDVHFVCYSLPRNVKGLLIKDQGQYTIYINNEISIEEQKKAIKHELGHLVQDDMSSDEDAGGIEREMRT